VGSRDVRLRGDNGFSSVRVSVVAMMGRGGVWVARRARLKIPLYQYRSDGSKAYWRMGVVCMAGLCRFFLFPCDEGGWDEGMRVGKHSPSVYMYY
jgi:hypothetical protein